jgi:drug/metabolite transporter (DMT)-like permease
MKWVLVGIIVGCNACSDVLNTMGMRRHGTVNDFAPKGVLRFVYALARNRYVLAAIVAMAVSFFALISLLSIAPVSFALPATAASFVIETLLARLVLHEDVRFERWLGATVVAFGVALLALP